MVINSVAPSSDMRGWPAGGAEVRTDPGL